MTHQTRQRGTFSRNTADRTVTIPEEHFDALSGAAFFARAIIDRAKDDHVPWLTRGDCMWMMRGYFDDERPMSFAEFMRWVDKVNGDDGGVA